MDLELTRLLNEHKRLYEELKRIRAELAASERRIEERRARQAAELARMEKPF